MNAKTDGWESYTDQTGRRHWRWPASETRTGAGNPLAEAESPQQFGLPRRQQAQHPPLRLKGK
jgi:hypothetical protein